MTRGGWLVGLPDDMGMEELALGVASDSEFWDYVDSTPGHSFYRGGQEWDDERRDGCLARKSDGGRCGQWLADRSPFCGFHLTRALSWMLGRACAEEVQKQRTRIGLRAQSLADTYGLARNIIEANADVRVYFYLIPAHGIVKIGSSGRPEHRVKSFARGEGCKFPDGINPAGGELLGHIAGGRALETALHQQFASERVIGTEWFAYSERLENFIAEALAIRAAS